MNEMMVVDRPDVSAQQMELAQMPVLSIQKVVERFNALGEFVQKVMRPGADFGAVPGTEKNTLLKPGAEKLCTLFGLSKRFEMTHKIEDWTGDQHGCEPLFYYVYRCRLFRGDLLIAEADGSANSRESKYRWRWVKGDDVPKGLNRDMLLRRSGSVSEFAVAIDKAETSGPYGKKPEYWKRFKDAIANGTARKITKQTKSGKNMDAWEIGDELYRVPNDDIASQINTLQKMSQKRALVAATLLAVNASEYFTQDVEDFEPIEVPASPAVPDPAPQQSHAPTQAAAPSNPSPEMELANLRSAAQAALQACAKSAGGGAAGRTEAVEALKRITGKSKVGEVVDAAALRRLIDALGKARQRIAGNGGDAGNGGPDLSSWETFYNTIIESAIGQVTPKQVADGVQKALQLIDMAENWEDTGVEWRRQQLDAVKAKKFNWSTGEIEE